MDTFSLKVLAVLALHDLSPGDPVGCFMVPPDWIGMTNKVDRAFAELARAGFLEEKIFVMEQNEDDPSAYDCTHEIPPDQAHRAELTRIRYFATNKIPSFTTLPTPVNLPRVVMWVPTGPG